MSDTPLDLDTLLADIPDGWDCDLRPTALGWLARAWRYDEYRDYRDVLAVEQPKAATSVSALAGLVHDQIRSDYGR